MFLEAAEGAGVVAAQLSQNAAQLASLGASLRTRPPRAVVTCARGSSDHAATYARYLIEAHTQALTSSAAPSMSSVYDASTDMRDVLFIAISQSGKSPDLLAATENARRGGAHTIALCNSPGSPLMRAVDVVIPLHAGAETSVAATKSYIATLSCVVQLVANWAQDFGLSAELARLPGQLARAWQCDWSGAVDALTHAHNLYVVGRGFGLGIAQEAALKLKETCGLHAEAFSSAEVMHGPLALVGPGFPVLALSQNDESAAGSRAVAERLVSLGATVMSTGGEAGTVPLPVLRDCPAVTMPLCAVQSFYMAVHRLAKARGFDPDTPIHLRKVTETM